MAVSKLGAHVIVLQVEGLHVGASEPLDKGPGISRMIVKCDARIKQKARGSELLG